MANLPTFAIGTFNKIQPAIEAGILTYPSYVFVEDRNNLIFVDKDLNIRPIEGYNQKDIIRCETLPAIDEADKEKFYICKNVVYEFTGTTFRPLFQDITDRLDAIEADIAEIKKTATLFGTADSPLPETSEENRLYVDTETREFGYYDKENGKIKLSGNTSSESITWIEL